MRDAEREHLLRLADWRPALGVISTYFAIDHGDRGGGWRVALRDGLDALSEPHDHDGKLALRETVKRVLERFDPERPPPGRTQVGFVEVARKGGAEDWSSLQISVRQRVVRHAPRPLLGPLIELLDRGRPRAVLAISAERVRGWTWNRGELEPEPGWDEELGIFPGRERKGAKPQDPARGQAVSSSGRDQFGQRLEQNRKRFLQDFARRVGEDRRVHGAELIAIGEAPYLDEFVTALPGTLQLRKLDGPDVIGEQDGAIAERVGPEIEAGLAQREGELTDGALAAAMAAEGRGALGADQVSAALAEGRVEQLLIDCERRLALEDLSPLAREAISDAEALGGCELMVELALRTSAEVTPLVAQGAEALREHGGVAALLRY